MADILDWPPNIEPTAIGLDLAWHSRGGGPGLNGVEQIVSPLSVQWEMAIELNLSTRDRLLAYRSIKARLKGRYGWLRFRICDPHRVTLGDIGVPIGPHGTPHSDKAFFSDDMGYAAPDLLTTVGVGGIVGDETILLNVAGLNNQLTAGQFFSINDYLYLITEVGDVDGDNQTFSIAPPLREDVSAGASVILDHPTMLCRLVDDRSGAGRFQYGKFGEPEMVFVEVLQRAV